MTASTHGVLQAQNPTKDGTNIQKNAYIVRMLTRDAIVCDPGLSLFQKVLLTTDGSVTELLSLYTGQPIHVCILEQSLSCGEAPNALQCTEEALLLRRKILLNDNSATQVYAESIFLFDRLSSHTRDMLVNSNVPIGLLWKQEKAEMYREIISSCIEHNPDVAEYFSADVDQRLISRDYLLYQGGRPMGVITEKFPETYFVHHRDSQVRKTCLD